MGTTAAKTDATKTDATKTDATKTDATKTATTTDSKTTATTTAAAAPKAAAIVDLQSAEAAAKFNVQRFEAKAGALAFSFSFTGLSAGKKYDWMCEATSLSPSNPAFRTKMVKGSATTNKAPEPASGDSALWSSLFAAILMIAAVFFY